MPREVDGREVDGYDAAFWRDSYRMLTAAIDEHLQDFIEGGEESEEYLYEQAIIRAGAATRRGARGVVMVRLQSVACSGHLTKSRYVEP